MRKLTPEDRKRIQQTLEDGRRKRAQVQEMLDRIEARIVERKKRHS